MKWSLKERGLLAAFSRRAWWLTGLYLRAHIYTAKVLTNQPAMTQSLCCQHTHTYIHILGLHQDLEWSEVQLLYSYTFIAIIQPHKMPTCNEFAGVLCFFILYWGSCRPCTPKWHLQIKPSYLPTHTCVFNWDRIKGRLGWLCLRGSVVIHLSEGWWFNLSPLEPRCWSTPPKLALMLCHQSVNVCERVKLPVGQTDREGPLPPMCEWVNVTCKSSESVKWQRLEKVFQLSNCIYTSQFWQFSLVLSNLIAGLVHAHSQMEYNYNTVN